MARGALEVFKEQVVGRTTRGAVAGGNNKMSEFTTIRMHRAEASALIDAAELMMLHRDVRDTLSIVESDKPADVKLQIRSSDTFVRDQALGAGCGCRIPRGRRLCIQFAAPVRRFLARRPVPPAGISA